MEEKLEVGCLLTLVGATICGATILASVMRESYWLSSKLLNVFIELLLLVFLPPPFSQPFLFPVVYLTVCAKLFSFLWNKVMLKEANTWWLWDFLSLELHLWGPYKCVLLNGLVTLISMICLFGFCNSLTIFLPCFI